MAAWWRNEEEEEVAVILECNGTCTKWPCHCGNVEIVSRFPQCFHFQKWSRVKWPKKAASRKEGEIVKLLIFLEWRNCHGMHLVCCMSVFGREQPEWNWVQCKNTTEKGRETRNRPLDEVKKLWFIWLIYDELRRCFIQGSIRSTCKVFYNFT